MQRNLTKIFENSQTDQERYVSLIESMNEVAKEKDEIASYFIEKNVFLILRDRVRHTFRNYKKNKSLIIRDASKHYQSDDLDHKEIIQSTLRKKVFAVEIELVGSLFSCQEEDRKGLYDEKIFELLSITTEYNTDPLILSSICYLGLQMLTQVIQLMEKSQKDYKKIKDDPTAEQNKVQKEKIKTDAEQKEYFGYVKVLLEKMLNCVCLLEYLGDSSFIHQLDLVKAQQKDQGKNKVFYSMDDPVIHKLIISIIKLINYFSVELNNLNQRQYQTSLQFQDKNLQDEFKQACEALNIKGRENKLFECMKIQSDEVRLVVVDGLYNVSLNEFDQDEIETLIRNLAVQNISAGETELVLSTILWILTKLVKDKKSMSSDDFKKKLCKDAIEEALKILKKNSERLVTDQEEEKQKFILSITIVNFFHWISNEDLTKKYLDDKGPELKEILYLEQKNTQPINKHIPIEIEFTQMGANLKNLWGVISGHNSIKPYTYSAFRILYRIANILGNDAEDKLFDPYTNNNQSIEKISEKLLQNYETRLTDKIDKERSLWTIFDEKKTSQESELIYQKQHKIFATTNGHSILSNFLVNTRSQNGMFYDHIMDEKIENAGVGETSLNKHLKRKLKEIRVQQKQETKLRKQKHKKKGWHSINQAQPQELAYEQPENFQIKKLVERVKYQNLSDGYTVNDSDQMAQSNKQTILEKKLRRRIPLTPLSKENLEVKNVCISAFLRALFEAVDCPQHSDKACENLSDIPIIKHITQLCASTGWFDCNIGTKYLSVIKCLIDCQIKNNDDDKKDKQKNSKEVDKKDIQLLEIFALVIQRILCELRLKMKKTDRIKKFSHEEKHLIYLVIIVCKVIFDRIKNMSQLYPVPDNHDKTEECDQLEKQSALLLQVFLENLLPLKSVQVLIDIAMQNMTEDDYVVKSLIMKTLGNNYDQIESEEQIQQDFQNQLDVFYTRNEIKEFMGAYLAGCSLKTQYKIVQSMMQNIVFEKNLLSKSFVEDVLTIFEEAKERRIKMFKAKEIIMKDRYTIYQDLIKKENAFTEQIKKENPDQSQEDVQKLLLKQIQEDKKYCQLSQEYIALDNAIHGENECFSMTADVLYDRSLASINEDDKDLHYHRRFIIATDKQLYIFKEKNEKTITKSGKIEYVSDCHYSTVDKPCKLYHKDRVDDFCELQIQTPFIIEVQHQIGLHDSQIALLIKLSNDQFSQEEWKFKKKDFKSQRYLLINFRLNSVNDAIKLQEYASFAMNAQEFKQKEFKTIHQELQNFFNDAPQEEEIKNNLQEEQQISNFILYVKTQDEKTFDPNVQIQERHYQAKNKRDGKPFTNLKLFVHNQNTQQIMLLDFPEDKMHFEHLEAEETKKVREKKKGKTKKQQKKQEKESFLTKIWGPYDTYQKIGFTPFLVDIQFYADTAPGLTFTFQTLSEITDAEPEQKYLEQIQYNLLFLSDEYRHHAIQQILQGIIGSMDQGEIFYEEQ